VVVLDIKHDCEQPYGYELHARVSSRHGKRKAPLMIRGTARCRKCEACMRNRAWFWRSRAIAEYATWPVSCFGTLTLRPEEHYRFDAMIETGSVGRPAVRLRDLSATEAFGTRVSAIGTEITNWIKRLRKGDKEHKDCRLRYLIVAEMHNGAQTSDEMRHRPHFHVFLHEMKSSSLFSGSPIRALVDGKDVDWERKWYKPEKGVWRYGAFLRDESFVRAQWTLGHTKFQFAESEKAAWYICKYLTKTLDCRVRSSQLYGLLGTSEEDRARTDRVRERPRSGSVEPLTSRAELGVRSETKHGETTSPNAVAEATNSIRERGSEADPMVEGGIGGTLSPRHQPARGLKGLQNG